LVVSQTLSPQVEHLPQSWAHEAQVSPLSQALLPQVLQTPQSCGHEPHVSALLQAPSPHDGQKPQSGEQLEQVSPPSQLPLPHGLLPPLPPVDVLVSVAVVLVAPPAPPVAERKSSSPSVDRPQPPAAALPKSPSSATRSRVVKRTPNAVGRRKEACMAATSRMRGETRARSLAEAARRRGIHCRAHKKKAR
jgi:hypothetical protein